MRALVDFLNVALVPPESSLWIPIPLRSWFWVTYICVLVAGAIALEVALHYSHKNRGMSTLPAVGVTMILVGLWAWTDLEVKRLQMHMRDCQVAHGSLLLLSLPTYPSTLDTTINNLRAISLNGNEQVQDLTGAFLRFLGASGFASASIVYGLGDPPFVHKGYTVGNVELPLQLATNGTMKVNTTAIFTDPGCRDPDQVRQDLRVFGWNNSATFSGCQFFWHVDKRSVNLFGAETMSNCTALDTSNATFAPAIFWFFTYSPSAMASVTMCAPKITLLNVEASIDLASSNLTDVRPLSNLTVGQDPFTQYAGNITGAPLNGRAFNGLNWTSLVTDPFVTARAVAVQLQLPAAAFQNAVESPAGLTAAFVNNTFASLSADVYRKYLSILGSLLYFVDAPQPMTATVFTFQKRLFLADTAVHILSVGMLLLALFGTLMHLAHREERRGLRLLHKPGTLASAAALTAQTPMAELLDGRQRPEEMNEALQNRRFRIDPRRMKIVTEGEAGYQDAVSPSGWRRSFFGAMLQGEVHRTATRHRPGQVRERDTH
ncbi:hypothetical protein BC826DRAFT_908693 [Russula brevipes]|nr:hypothetical protein BC826DRAFT_908693 [Russula brevipes]